jgi:Skp family chaperone for outer membrane proteins
LRNEIIKDDSHRQQGVLNVKFSIAWAALAAGTLQFCFTASLLAQGNGADGGTRAPIAPAAVRPSGTNVAVLDISLVFEHFPAFQEQMTKLKSEVDQFEGFLKEEQKKLVEMREKLGNFEPGSKQFKETEEEMARANTDLRLKMEQQRREFLEREARIYFDGYAEVYNVVSTLADRNDIRLVLRFSSDSMKADDRGSVLQSVNRPVIYQKNLNITNLVIKGLGGKPPAPKPLFEEVSKRPPKTSLK